MNEQFSKALDRLTEGLDEASLEQLETALTTRELKDGEQIITAGKRSVSMFIVGAGALRVSVAQGKKLIALPELHEGDWVGEISVLDPGPASANVQARGATTVFEFSNSKLLEFMKTHPAGALQILSTLSVDLAIRLQHTSDGLVRLGKDGLELTYRERQEHAGLLTSLLHVLHRLGGQS